MDQFSQLSENLRKKSQLILRDSFNIQTLQYKVHLVIHQIPFCFHVSQESIIQELYDNYPLAWFHESAVPGAIPIFWYDSRDLGFEDSHWEDEASYDCFVARDKNREAAVHRDFAAMFNGESCTLICPYSVQDGFYNFLRWIAPIKFLGQKKLLLHSSCVIDQNKNAYFCLGPSGAGKTTIASLRPRKKILGDDMNVIKIEDGKCWAQAGALGQALLNPTEYTNWYPVKAIFWLKKDIDVGLKNISRASQMKYLSTAVANVFWSHLSHEQSLTIFNDMNEILKIREMFELSFPMDRRIWDFVFETFKEEL